MQPSSLDQWLQHLATLHPSEIELGLDRIRQVWSQQCEHLSATVITVAGTNGKGSSVAMLEAIYLAAGYKVASYTSPHILSFNERIHVNGQPVNDDLICAALANIDHSRRDIPLTYFEFTTLAAFDIFSRQTLDLIILETGLGGRLDAVNIIDADIALITTIALDHTDWLGDDIQTIGREKAGILRQGGKAVLADPEMPESVLQIADQLAVDYCLAGKDYQFVANADDWVWRGDALNSQTFALPVLSGQWQIQNAAAVVAVTHLLHSRLPVAHEAINNGLQHIQLPGRFQLLADMPKVYADVSHNVQALKSLKQNIVSHRGNGKVVAVFSMLSDKDIPAAVDVMMTVIDCWVVCGIDDSRGLSADQLVNKMSSDLTVSTETSVSSAIHRLQSELDDIDLIVVFGSFYVVAEAIIACK